MEQVQTSAGVGALGCLKVSHRSRRLVGSRLRAGVRSRGSEQARRRGCQALLATLACVAGASAFARSGADFLAGAVLYVAAALLQGHRQLDKREREREGPAR